MAVTTVTSSPTAAGFTNSYQGNNDYRGFLAAQNNPLATQLLGAVGNNGVIDPTKLNSLGSDVAAYNTAAQQAFSTYQTQLPGADASSTIIPGVNDPATIAGYGQAIADTNQTIGQLPTQLQGTEDQIQNAYNTAYQQLLGQGNQAASTYQTNTTGNQQNYVTNKNSINTSAGQSLNGIERLLGSRGAGGSSAATIVAPQDVAQEASANLAGAASTYGSNQSGLDTSYGNYKIQNANDIASIGTQQQNQDTAAEATIANTRGGLLQQLATLSAQQAAAEGNNPTTAAAPYLAAAQTALSAANQLGLNVAPLNYNTTAYAAPSAASYTPNPFAAPVATNAPQGITNNTVSPSLSPLLKGATSLSGVPNTAAPAATPTAGS